MMYSTVQTSYSTNTRNRINVFLLSLHISSTVRTDSLARLFLWLRIPVQTGTLYCNKNNYTLENRTTVTTTVKLLSLSSSEIMFCYSTTKITLWITELFKLLTDRRKRINVFLLFVYSSRTSTVVRRFPVQYLLQQKNTVEK